jgi:hypothetical protein
MLEGYVDLKYLDESGFWAWSGVSYSYSRTGEQKRLEQPKKRAKRLSVIGLLGQGKSFEYGLIEGSFNSQVYIKFMDMAAHRAAQQFKKTGRITVVIQDNSSVHRSNPHSAS